MVPRTLCVHAPGEGHELQVMHVEPPGGTSWGDLPAFFGGSGDFGEASRLGVPACHCVPGLRLGAFQCS